MLAPENCFFLEDVHFLLVFGLFSGGEVTLVSGRVRRAMNGT